MASIRYLPVLATSLALGLTMALWGCGGEGSDSSLHEDIKLLKTEVAQLQQEVATLKASNKALATSRSTRASVTTPEDTPIKGDRNLTFADLEGYHSKKLIEELAQLGVFDGMGKTFKPDDPVTRGEYITWLFHAYNALSSKEKILFAQDLEPQFKDLDKSHPAYNYVQALAGAGISVGYDDGTFRPDQPITREELIAIKVGVDAGAQSPHKSQMAHVWKFSDADEVDNRFSGYIHKDYYVGGPEGSNINRAFGKIKAFRPKSPVLRHQAAATLWQVDQHGYLNARKALESKSQS